MSRALDGLNSLPWGVHLMVTLFMAVGLILWLTGERMLKPLVVAGAAALGGLIGSLVTSSTGWGASLTVWHGIGLGVIGGFIVGLLLFRSAMAVGFGLVLGLLLPLIAATSLRAYSGGDATAQADINLQPVVELARFDRLQDAAPKIDVEQVPDNLKPIAERVGECWNTLSGEVSTQWRSMPSSHQAIVLMAAAIGLAGGVIAGLSMPKWAGGAVSSMFGAALWLPSMVWLSNAFHAPWREQFDRSPGQWLLIWAGVTALGMIAQWLGLTGGRKKKPAPKPAPAPAAA